MRKTDKAIYPGTFDPITRGHEDLVRRASGLFDQVVVAVAPSSGKEPFFTLDERVKMAREVLIDCANIEVTEFSGLLMEFLQQQNARVILRGLRAVSDFEYEFQMAGMNDQLNPDIETVFLMADPALQEIASRLVKESAIYDGEIDKFVTSTIRDDVLGKLGKK